MSAAFYGCIILIEMSAQTTTPSLMRAFEARLQRGLTELAAHGTPGLSVATKIDQCKNAQRIWAALEQQVAFERACVFEQETTMLALVVRSLLCEHTIGLEGKPLAGALAVHAPQTALLRFFMQLTACNFAIAMQLLHLDAALSAARLRNRSWRAGAPDATEPCVDVQTAISNTAAAIFASVAYQPYYQTACMLVLRSLHTGMSVATFENGNVMLMCSRAQAARAVSAN